MTQPGRRDHPEKTPLLKAFVLADHVYTDALTAKRVVAGTFNTVSVKSFPGVHKKADAFILITECSGKTLIQLRFVRLRDNQLLMESGEIQIESDDELAVLDLAIAIPAIPLPEEGGYCFECYANGSLIGNVRLTAKQSS